MNFGILVAKAEDAAVTGPRGDIGHCLGNLFRRAFWG